MSLLPRGVLPASITPFSADGQVDLPGVARLLARSKSQGCAGVVLAGSNGEGPSLSAVEKRDLIRAAVPLAQGLPVVLGVATPSLDEAIWSCESARKAGAAAALVMAPGFFREASEEGIAGWFEQLLGKTTIPIILYNFPKRTGFTFSPEMVARLCAHEGIVAVKDSSGNADNLVSFAQASAGRNIYVGDETLLLKALEAGWTGTISGASNIFASWLVPVIAEWHTDRESAETKFAYILPSLVALRSSPQPASNKWLLKRLGIIDLGTPRLPLLPLGDEVGESLWEEIGKMVV